MSYCKLLSTMSAAALLLSGLNAANAASVPMSLTHHGIVWDGDQLFNGDKTIKAELLSVADNDSTVITNKVDTINIVDGFYSISIDITNENFKAIKEANGHLAMKITLGGVELSPLVPINSVPYAMVSEYADTAGYVECEGCIGSNHLDSSLATIIQNASEKEIASGSVTMEKLSDDVKNSLTKADAALQGIPDDYITSSMLKNNSVTIGKIAGGAVDNAALHTDCITTDKIQDGAIYRVDLADNAGILGSQLDKNANIAKTQLDSGVQQSLAKADAAAPKDHNHDSLYLGINATADKATADANGNNIAETYMLKSGNYSLKAASRGNFKPWKFVTCRELEGTWYTSVTDKVYQQYFSLNVASVKQIDDKNLYTVTFTKALSDNNYIVLFDDDHVYVNYYDGKTAQFDPEKRTDAWDIKFIVTEKTASGFTFKAVKKQYTLSNNTISVSTVDYFLFEPTKVATNENDCIQKQAQFAYNPEVSFVVIR